MKNDYRKKHFEFIENDTKERGETIVSDITFFAAIYECRVKKEGEKKSRSVMYSAAEMSYRQGTLPSYVLRLCVCCVKINQNINFKH